MVSPSTRLIRRQVTLFLAVAIPITSMLPVHESTYASAVPVAPVANSGRGQVEDFAQVAGNSSAVADVRPVKPVQQPGEPIGPASPQSVSARARVSASLKNAPLLFVENAGQFDPGARFQVRGASGSALWLAEDALWLTVMEGSSTSPSDSDRRDRDASSAGVPERGVNIRLSFIGANPHPRLEAFNRQDTHVSYLTGSDPSKWHAGVPVWAGVRYVDLYPGIDLELSGQAGNLLPKIIARNGADPTIVQLHVDGATSVRVDRNLLRLSTPVGDVAFPLLQGTNPSTSSTQLAPLALANVRGNDITSPYATLPSQGAAPLTGSSDLFYSTYLGTGYANAIAIDSSGAAYITGDTNSSAFPTTPGAFDTEHNGYPYDAFVTKFNATGSSLIYSTFIGGTDDDHGYAIAVGIDGSAYVGGDTSSSNFPTTPGAYDTTYNQSISGRDAFVVKLLPDGSALAYITYLGGTSSDQINALALDAAGAVYVTGETQSTNFPTTPDAYDTSCSGCTNYYDSFVTKINAAGSDLVFSTFLGGSNGSDYGNSIATDSSGSVFVAGYTASSYFPTTPGAYDIGLSGTSDAFVTKLNATGTALIYSTFLGGSDGSESAYGIALAADGAAFVTGYTKSSVFPNTTGAFDRTLGGTKDAFVTKLSAAGSGLIYSTYLGGNDLDEGDGIAVDSSGVAYVTGQTKGSTSFPTTIGAFDTTFNGAYDAFVTKLNAAGSALVYSTFLGGSGNDYGQGIAVAPDSGTFIAGYTASSDFPVTAGAYDTVYNGSTGPFVSKLALAPAVPNNTTLSLSGSGDTREAGISGVAESAGEVADHINTRTGAFYYNAVDLSVSTTAGPLVFARSYASSATGLYSANLGNGWTHSQDIRLIFSTQPGGEVGAVWFKAESVNQYRFEDKGDGTFSPYAGVLATLTKSAGPPVTYSLVDATKSTYTFDATGKLTSWVDPEGHTLTYTYDASQRLTQVKDAVSQRFLTFAYDPTVTTHLASVTDHTGRQVRFGYDAVTGDLTSVTDVLNHTWNYSYTSRRLERITDPRSRRCHAGRVRRPGAGDSRI